MYTDAGAIETCAQHKGGRKRERRGGQMQGESSHNATAMCQDRNNKANAFWATCCQQSPATAAVLWQSSFSPHFPLPLPLLLLPLLCPATHVFCIHECYSIYVNVFSANCALTSSWDDELVLRSSSQMHLQMSSIVRHTPHTHTHTHTPHTCVHIFPIHFIPPPPSAPTSCLLPIWCALIEYINEISEFPFCGFIGFRLRRSNFIWKILQLKRILYFLYGEGKFTIG